MKFHITATWRTLGCYVTISDDSGSMNLCMLFESQKQIAELVDALVVAANSKPEEKTDAR